MKIKVFITDSKYKIVKVAATDDVAAIANQYNRWEYVL